MNINLNKMSYYIAGLFDGEGSVGKNTVIITNTNLRLLQIIHIYLNNLNIKSSIKIRKHPKKINHSQAYDIKIFGRKNLLNFYTYIPFFHQTKRKKLLEYIIKTKTVISSKELKKMKKYKQNKSYREIAKCMNKSLGMTYDYINDKRKPNH